MHFTPQSPVILMSNPTVQESVQAASNGAEEVVLPEVLHQQQGRRCGEEREVSCGEAPDARAGGAAQPGVLNQRRQQRAVAQQACHDDRHREHRLDGPHVHGVLQADAQRQVIARGQLSS